MEYDLQKETRVWERIRTPQCQNRGADAAEIAKIVCAEMADACFYRALAAALPAKERRCLLEIAQDENKHAKTLSAIYFLLQGQRLCPERPPRFCPSCLTEELRKRWREELAAAERYEKLAGQMPEFASTFRCLAADEKRHAQMILCLLQKMV